MNQMLINVATRKFARSVRLRAGDVPAPAGAGLSKSAASRRFVALSAARMKQWMASDLFGLDLLVIQIDGIHMDEDLILVAAIGVDAKGDKHPLGLAEGATENAATVQALIDNLVERGLDPAVPRLFIIDGAKALSKAIRRTFGAAAAIQRCQVHKARNIMERCPNRCTLRSGAYYDKHGSWTTLTRPKSCSAISPNVSNVTGPGLRLDFGRHQRDPHRHAAWDAEGAAARAGLYQHDRECDGHGAACLPQREAMRLASMAMRWTAAAMQVAAKGFRRLKAHKQLPVLRAALETTKTKTHAAFLLAKPMPPNINLSSDRFAMFNKKRDISEKAQRVRFPNLKPSTTAISLRLPVTLLERIKVAANKRDVPYQSLIKTWLAEKTGT